MSNIKSVFKKSKLEFNSKEKAEVENEDEYFSNKIEIPKSSYPNSNDISKINSSLFSPVESEENKKNLSIQFEKCKINLDNEIYSNINPDSLNLNRRSNLSFERYVIDEIVKAEKFSAENEK